MRMLGIDLGQKRIGVAVMDSDSRIATPRQPVSALGALAKEAQTIAKLAQQEEAEIIILGLPLENGAEGKRARVSRKLGAILEEQGLKVGYADETMTSAASEDAMYQAGIKSSQRKARIDSESACRILEAYQEPK